MPEDLLSEIAILVEDAENIKAAKKERPKKASKSYKPLKFEITDNTRPIKAAIIQHLNNQNKTYDDLKEYFHKLYEGTDRENINSEMYNAIGSLKKDSTGMRDDKISMFLDFLNLDMFLIKKGTNQIDYLAQNLVMALKQEPERLYEVLDYITDQVNDNNTEEGEDEE